MFPNTKQIEDIFASGNHLYSGDHDSIVATIYDKHLDKKNILGASLRMFVALENLERLNFGASGSTKELAAAILDAKQVLAIARGKIQ